MSAVRSKNRQSTDMTSGSPVRQMIRFALPLFIGNLFQQLYNVADTMVAGYTMGDTAIAAIGATSSLYMLLTNFVYGMNSGFTIVATQRFGAKDSAGLRSAVAGMFTMNAIIVLILALAALCFLDPILGFVNIPQAIYGEARQYISVIIAGLASSACYNMLSGLIRAMGNSRVPLLILIFSSILNILLDILLLAVVKTGVQGAAVATIISQTVSAALCGAYIYRRLRGSLPRRRQLTLKNPLLRELLSNGFAAMVMYCVVDLGTVLYQRATNDLGTDIITAYSASRKVFSVTILLLVTFSDANLVFAGQNYGAGFIRRIWKGARSAICLGVIWSLAVIATVFIAGDGLIYLLTGTANAEIVQNAVLNMRWFSTFYPILSAVLVLRTTMQAMGRKLLVAFGSVMELIIKILAANWLIPRIGFLGTCVTEPVIWVIMLVYLLPAAIRVAVSANRRCDLSVVRRRSHTPSQA